MGFCFVLLSVLLEEVRKKIKTNTTKTNLGGGGRGEEVGEGEERKKTKTKGRNSIKNISQSNFVWDVNSTF